MNFFGKNSYRHRPLRAARVAVFILTGVLLIGFRHVFYVSICSVEENTKTELLEITFRIFTDDLEKALLDEYHLNLRLGTEKEHIKTDSLLFEYIRRNFRLQLEKQPAHMRFIGKEVEIDLTWIYLEIPKKEKVKKITVLNRLLIDSFETQKNIVHLNIQGQKKSLLFRKGHSEDSIGFPAQE